MCEKWMPIKGYEGLYEVSSYGRVRTLPKAFSYPRLEDGILKANNLGMYKSVTLCKDGKTKICTIHRLVATAFIPNPDNLPQVNHIDENKHNNRADNLEWVTQRQNLAYSHVQEKLLKAAHKANEKAVEMYDRNGNYIKTFESATKAAKAIGSYQQNVSVCCYDWTKTTKGYRFKFKED